MCGIAGMVRFDGGDVAAGIRAMLAKLVHRGPDGEGARIEGAMGLGHRRLAIIDPAGGAQPLGNEDGRVWASCNGEIYNYRELRRELQDAGHRFTTDSDCEVVVHAYEQWGDDCVLRLRGMFAIAVADWRRGRLFIARDHLGIKPLYYARTPAFFAFASEIQALRELPGVGRGVDLGAVDQYLCFGYVPGPGTAHPGIGRLPPAHRLAVEGDGRAQDAREYWRLEMRPAGGRDPREWLEALDGVLSESVKAHLMADVPFGAFLSGGVDSTAVVGYMAQHLARPVRTFSIGFREAEFDESRFAEEAARRFGTVHEAACIGDDAFAILPALVRHHGEPFGDSSAIATYHVSRLARRSVAMVLTGDGGDEAFGGYANYARWMRWLDPRARPPWQRAARRLAGMVLPARYPAPAPTAANWVRMIATFPAHQRAALWRPETAPAPAGLPPALAAVAARSDGLPPVTMAQAFDYASYLPDDILTKVDIASMAHGLETRTPLVDIRVVEFAATIPQEVNVRAGGPGGWEGKLLLKRILARSFPRAFIDRPKQGFAVPLDAWLFPGGRPHEQVHERLLGPDSHLRPLFAPAAIRGLVRARRCGPLWMLLFLEEWLRQNAASPAA